MTLRSPGLIARCVFVLVPLAAFSQDRFFDSDGIRIRYVDGGQGEPVVLIHGFTGRVEGWNRGGTFEALARDYRVVALDCRGHGKSDKPHSPEQYGAHMAIDVLRLMDHLELSKAHVVGYSMGARITGYLLANHPDRLITATLGASPPRRAWGKPEQQRASAVSARMAERARTAPDSDPRDYVALAAIPQAWQTQVVEDDRLSAAAVPTLAIVGTEDPRVDELNALKRDVMPKLTLVVIKGADHSEALGRPEFLRALQEFLALHATAR